MITFASFQCIQIWMTIYILMISAHICAVSTYIFRLELLFLLQIFDSSNSWSNILVWHNLGKLLNTINCWVTILREHIIYTTYLTLSNVWCKLAFSQGCCCLLSVEVVGCLKSHGDVMRSGKYGAVEYIYIYVYI